MASDGKTVVDDWSGEADLHAMSAEEERAFIEEGLDSVERYGTVSHEEAMRRIDQMLANLRAR